MNKEQLYKDIKNSIESNSVSPQELVEYVKSLGSAAPGVENKESKKNSLIPKVLFSIGGLIALVGILVLLANNWDTIGFAGRWIVTMGLGVTFFVSAGIIAKKQEFDILSQVFFVLSAFGLSIGSFVWIGETSLSAWKGYDILTLVASLNLGVFSIALYVYRKSVLHIIVTTFFTLLVNALVSRFIENSGYDFFTIKDILAYVSMCMGVLYLVYASWIRSINMTTDSSPVYRFLIFSAFCSFFFGGLFLGGFWNVLYPLVAIGGVSLSVYLRSQIGLTVTGIAIAIYCIKISIQYFSDSIGFSLTLLLSGLCIIGLGYLTYALNKKYISKQN